MLPRGPHDDLLISGYNANATHHNGIEPKRRGETAARHSRSFKASAPESFTSLFRRAISGQRDALQRLENRTHIYAVLSVLFHPARFFYDDHRLTALRARSQPQSRAKEVPHNALAGSALPRSGSCCVVLDAVAVLGTTEEIGSISRDFGPGPSFRASHRPSPVYAPRILHPPQNRIPSDSLPHQGFQACPLNSD